jgi:hypothetical protein
MVGTFGLLVVVHALITNVMIRILSLWQYQRAEDGRQLREQQLADRASTAVVGPAKLVVDLTKGS